MNHARLIGLAGVVVWLMVGVPVIIGGANSAAVMAGWSTAFVLFGALFVLDLRRPRLAWLALEALAVVVMVLLLCHGFEGTLMVLIAMQLGSRTSRAAGMGWIAAQTLLLAAAIAIHWSPRPAWLLTPPYLGFQVLAFFIFQAMEQEIAARRALTEVNAELRALQEIVAGSSRIAERLRIAQELHDALGHHLTALTLNLEAALRRSDGGAKRDVETAQTLARQLLSDVRAIVAGNEAYGGVNLAHALQTFVADIPQPRVHLEIDDALRVDDPERGHIVLRCTQEIVTNAARHSGAENLWIVVERCGDALRIRAHDDGRGSDRSGEGFGLRNMRARIEGAGGELRIASRPGHGFDVIAELPARSGAA